MDERAARAENRRFDGPIRKRFARNGEPAPYSPAHGAHLREAAKLLEQVLADMAHAQRAQGERRLALRDGTVITAASRFGQHEIIIDVPHAPPQPKPKREPKETPVPHPYLWVGARIAWERMNNSNDWHADWALMVAVYEPGVEGIVSNFPVFNYPDNGVYGGWNAEGYLEVNPRPAHVIPLWWDSAFRDADNIAAQVQTTRHGLYMTAMSMPNWDGNLFQYWGEGGPAPAGDYLMGSNVVYDPLATPAQLAARARPPEMETEWYDSDFPLWDVVTVLDPDPGMAPSDTRGQALNIAAMCDAFALPTGRKQILPGQYAVKVGSDGGCSGPIEVDIEVRVGKAPYTKTYRYAVSVEAGTDWYNNMHPYGQIIPSWYSQCPTDSRNNPHGTCWWQGAVLIDVEKSEVERREFYVPAHGYEPAPWTPWWECPQGHGPYVTYIAIHTDTLTNGTPIWQFAAWEAAFPTTMDPWGGPSRYPLSEYDLALVGGRAEAAQEAVTRPGLYRYELIDGSHVFTRYSDWTTGMYIGWATNVNTTVTPLLQSELDAGAYYASFHAWYWVSQIYLIAYSGGCPET